jgi:hypothetical protein
VLNQVPASAGGDYGYYTHNYAYYGDGGGKRRRSKRPAAPSAGSSQTERLVLDDPGRPEKK